MTSSWAGLSAVSNLQGTSNADRRAPTFTDRLRRFPVSARDACGGWRRGTGHDHAVLPKHSASCSRLGRRYFLGWRDHPSAQRRAGCQGSLHRDVEPVLRQPRVSRLQSYRCCLCDRSLYQTFFQRAPVRAASLTGHRNSHKDPGAAWCSPASNSRPSSTPICHTRLGATQARPEGTYRHRLYRGFLNRLPDDGGLNYWMSQMRQAQCAGGNALATVADSISSQFLNSAEYAARSRTNVDFVADLYSSFLRRYADLP